MTPRCGNLDAPRPDPLGNRVARHGLLLGKFYPPHAGHHHLIDTAATASAHLTVMVAAASRETGLSLDQRVAVVAAVHRDQTNVEVVGCVDDVPTDYDDPAVWDDHLAAWAPALRAPIDQWGPFDAVFASEGYGVELARRLGAVPVVVDPERAAFPLSSSEIRADILGHWEDLAKPTRAVLARRVVVVGAESTGTTTVSRALTQALRARGGALGATAWVPEYGRDYTWVKLASARAAAALRGAVPPGMDELVWEDADLVACAQGQSATIEAAVAVGPPVVVADTDARATTCWSRRYLGRAPAEVIAAADAVRVDLYLVTDHDGVAFVQDGIRDGEHVRAEMTDWFIEAVAASGVPYVVLEGSLEQRLSAALDAVDRVLEGGWGLAQPVEYLDAPIHPADQLRWLVNRLGVDRVSAALGVGPEEIRAGAARVGALPARPGAISALVETVSRSGAARGAEAVTLAGSTGVKP